jgi:hypothetical protein
VFPRIRAADQIDVTWNNEQTFAGNEGLYAILSTWATACRSRSGSRRCRAARATWRAAPRESTTPTTAPSRAGLVESGFGAAYLRIGWEFNGDWYRWSAGGDFKIEWTADKDGRFDERLAYPGDERVDVVGVDFYDMYPT